MAEPEDILASQEVNKDGEIITQWLIKWKTRTVDEATWEDEFIIRSQFPSFSLETDGIPLLGSSTAMAYSSGRGFPLRGLYSVGNSATIFL